MATTIINLPQDSKWVEYTGSADNDRVYTGTIYVRTIDHMVTVACYRITLKTAMTGSSLPLLSAGTMPKPNSVVWATAGNATDTASVTVGTTGMLTFYKPSDKSSWGTGEYISFTLTYMV